MEKNINVIKNVIKLKRFILKFLWNFNKKLKRKNIGKIGNEYFLMVSSENVDKEKVGKTQ